MNKTHGTCYKKKPVLRTVNYFTNISLNEQQIFKIPKKWWKVPYSIKKVSDVQDKIPLSTCPSYHPLRIQLSLDIFSRSTWLKHSFVLIGQRNPRQHALELVWPLPGNCPRIWKLILIPWGFKKSSTSWSKERFLQDIKLTSQHPVRRNTSQQV